MSDRRRDKMDSPAGGVTAPTAVPSLLTTGFADTIGATIGINLLSLALPLILLQIYDRIIPKQAMSTLTLLTLGVGSAVVLEALLQLARTTSASWSAARFEHLMGCSAMARVLGAQLPCSNGAVRAPTSKI